MTTADMGKFLKSVYPDLYKAMNPEVRTRAKRRDAGTKRALGRADSKPVQQTAFPSAVGEVLTTG